MTNKQLKYICVSGLFAGLLALVTSLLRIPIPNTGGYVHLGDSILFLFATLLPNPYVALAAGIGSALADLFAGAALYLLPTFVLKALMAFLVAKIIQRSAELKRVLPALLLAEALMVLGYFFYELFIFGWAVAGVSAVYNLVQLVVNVIVGVLLIRGVGKLHLHL